MAAVWYLFRPEARARWRSMLVLALLLGLAGGTALAAAAGARRTASAYPRYLRATRASDVTIDLPTGFQGGADQLAGALPGVVAHSTSIGMAALLAGPDGSPDLAGADQVVASVDGRFITSDGPALVRGRLPKLDRADEALVNQTMARRRHIAPGDRITVLRATAADVQAADGGIPASTSPLVLQVTGIVVNNTEIVQDDVSRLNLITLTPAYYAQHQEDALFPRLGLRLRDGHRGVPAVQATVQRLLSNQPDDPTSGVSVEDTGAIASRTQHAIRPLLEALVLFAAMAGVVGLLVIGQALSRDILLAAADNPTRSAVGADRTQLFLLSALSGAVVAVVGALVAVGVAVALSPLFPLGPVRVAEPDRGVSVDAAALAVGAVLMVVLVIARAVASAWTASRARKRERPARASRRTDRAIDSLPPSVAVGARFAVDLRRGGTLPLRASVAGSVAALAALLALVSFAGNLDHLQSTPAQYGWDWDLGFLSNAGYGVYAPEELRLLEDESAVAGYAAVSFAEVTVDGVATSALGFQTAKQPVLPPVIAGRAFSAGADEVMLGSATLRHVRKSVGEEVTIAIGGSSVRARVVGRTVLPAFGRVDTSRAGLGDGVALSAATFSRLADGFHPAAVVVRLAPHTPASAVQRLRSGLGDQARFERAYGPQRPADLVSGASGPASRLLVGLLSLAAAATLAHTLVGAVRQRRRDLAILKTLGFERRQVRTAVASLATTLLLTALVVGVPAGLVVGGWSWRVFAGRLGILPTTVVPLLAILAIVPAALVAANLVAAFPAWSAARTNPSGVLRTE